MTEERKTMCPPREPDAAWFSSALKEGRIRLTYYGSEGYRPKQLREQLMSILDA